MVQPRSGLRFNQKPPSPFDICNLSTREQFQGDQTTQPGVTRLIHLSHSPGTQRCQNFVWTDVRAGCERHHSHDLNAILEYRRNWHLAAYGDVGQRLSVSYGPNQEYLGSRRVRCPATRMPIHERLPACLTWRSQTDEPFSKPPARNSPRFHLIA